MCGIHFYRTTRGEQPVERYMAMLDIRHRQKVAIRLELLAQAGPDLRRPYADVVSGPIRELRIPFGRLEHRILYAFFAGQAVVLLHAFAKKTDAILRKDLETAMERKKDVDRRLAAGEVLE